MASHSLKTLLPPGLLCCSLDLWGMKSNNSIWSWRPKVSYCVALRSSRPLPGQACSALSPSLPFVFPPSASLSLFLRLWGLIWIQVPTKKPHSGLPGQNWFNYILLLLASMFKKGKRELCIKTPPHPCGSKNQHDMQIERKGAPWFFCLQAKSDFGSLWADGGKSEKNRQETLSSATEGGAGGREKECRINPPRPL